MADYIATTDIRDLVYKPLVTSDDITDSTNYFNDFAASKGVDEDDISTPVHYRIKEALIFFVQMRMAENRIGLNPGIPIRTENTTNAFDGDIHYQKYSLYKKMFEEAEQAITKEMILGDADTAQEYHSTSFSVLRS